MATIVVVVVVASAVIVRVILVLSRVVMYLMLLIGIVRVGMGHNRGVWVALESPVGDQFGVGLALDTSM